MNILKSTVIILVSTMVCACSSTSNSYSSNEQNNELNNGYFQSDFYHCNFTTSDQKSLKKTNNSDHQLMLSLLNRPMTEDKKMMLTFAQERASYLPSQLANGIQIKGQVEQDESNDRFSYPYSDLIAQDINATHIIAPN
ncbi:hypothetical protein [Litorilituus lipolyticus]|uniref:Uncharacterized protein n=1 Tax=Litorilituus lipolyticus TaxID=2491017 RepID=A0A502KQU0_9GAMM|nr:hypothetical protein [Litorilituus lipolyticus]TPH13846.1 hypothetical protein EPA86_11990 [Litorilituus lipolyticus]